MQTYVSVVGVILFTLRTEFLRFTQVSAINRPLGYGMVYLPRYKLKVADTPFHIQCRNCRMILVHVALYTLMAILRQGEAGIVTMSYSYLQGLFIVHSIMEHTALSMPLISYEHCVYAQPRVA